MSPSCAFLEMPPSAATAPARAPAAGPSSPVRLLPDERRAVETGRWFAGLPPLLRHDILARGFVRRYRHGWACARRGSLAQEWACVARGAVRVGIVGASGRALSLTYLKPGMWFGDVALLDGLPRPHDVLAHGDTTLLCVGKADFADLVSRHVELVGALLQLNCRRIRATFEQAEGMMQLPLPARLARQLQSLVRGWGEAHAHGVRIGLRLSQDELAQLLGASRQRVNLALRSLERQGVLRPDAAGLVVLDQHRLAEAAMTGSVAGSGSAAGPWCPSSAPAAADRAAVGAAASPSVRVRVPLESST